MTSYDRLTEEEIELDLLKAAITSPDLFASIKQVFHNHLHPESLDPTGRKLYEIFKRLENERDSASEDNHG